MLSREQVQSVVEGYVDGFNQGPTARARWLALFAEDAEQIDPVATPPNKGKEAVGGFFDTIFRNFDRLDFQLSDLFVCGQEAAMTFTINAYKPDGAVTFDGIVVFRIDESARIACIKAYWEPGRIKPLA